MFLSKRFQPQSQACLLITASRHLHPFAHLLVCQFAKVCLPFQQILLVMKPRHSSAQKSCIIHATINLRLFWLTRPFSFFGMSFAQSRNLFVIKESYFNQCILHDCATCRFSFKASSQNVLQLDLKACIPNQESLGGWLCCVQCINHVNSAKNAFVQQFFKLASKMSSGVHIKLSPERSN